MTTPVVLPLTDAEVAALVAEHRLHHVCWDYRTGEMADVCEHGCGGQGYCPTARLAAEVQRLREVVSAMQQQLDYIGDSRCPLEDEQP